MYSSSAPKSPIMEVSSAVLSVPYNHAQATISNNQESDCGTDPITFNGDIADLATQHSGGATGDSPGTLAVRELEHYNRKHEAPITPTKVSAKLVERPNSSGYEATAPTHFQIQTANPRSQHIKRPNMCSPPLSTVLTAVSVALEVDLCQPVVPIARLNPKLQGKANTPTRVIPTEAELSNIHLQLPTTRGTDRATGPGHKQDLLQDHEGKKDKPQCHSAKLAVQPDAQVPTNAEAVKFSFAPMKPRNDVVPAATKESLAPPEARARVERVSADIPTPDINAIQQDTVLPSVEADGVVPDESFLERPCQGIVRQEVLATGTRSDAPMPPPAPRAQRHPPVLEGRIGKPLRSNTRIRKPTPQRQPRPANADTSQPTEDDIYFLLMSRGREARDREHALEASQRKLQAQLHRLHERNETLDEELIAADALSTKQNDEIIAYQTQIEDFKARFTRFKSYARNLAQDYTAMGEAMKHIGSTTNDLIKYKADVDQSLESLHNSSAFTRGLLIDLRPKIVASAKAIVPLQNALQLAEVKVQITDASLQHERLRNNRIESQMLGSQQTQERLSLSSMQEYRKAANYLDDLCQAIIQLTTTVMKKKQSKDISEFVECTSLLQTLVKRQGTEMTTLTEMKALVGMISERLLSYHTSVEEATNTATNIGEKLGKDVVSQIATLLGGLGPSLGTEVNFAVLRERVASLQKQITMGTQMINLAFDGKNASEKREKEQAVRIDKLIEQVIEADRRPTPVFVTTPQPKPGFEVPTLITKRMRAEPNLTEAPLALTEKQAELDNKLTEIFTLTDELKTSRTQYEVSQASLTAAQGQAENLRRQADAAIKENISLKKQLEAFGTTALQAARLPDLIEGIATKDAELAQLRPQAVKAQELIETLTNKETELKNLRLEAAQVPALVEELTGKDTELHDLRIRLESLPQLHQELIDLRKTISAMSQLKEKVALTEAELDDLRPKAKSMGTANILLQSSIHDYKSANQQLEQQIKDLNADLGSTKQTASKVKELREQNEALFIEATSAKQSIQSLNDKVENARRSTQEVENLKKEITALQLDQSEYDQLKRNFTAQMDVPSKQVFHISDLQSKLGEAEAGCGLMSDLQGQVYELSQHCSSLKQQLDDSTKAAEGVEIRRTELVQKEEEITLLKTRLESFEVKLLQPGHTHETEMMDSQADFRASRYTGNASDLQPRSNKQSLTEPSSPLTDLEDASYISRMAGSTKSRRPAVDGQPPSSSSGGDSMLLEDFEAMDGMLKVSDKHKSVRYGDGPSRVALTSNSSTTNRLRSGGMSSQVVPETQATVANQGTRPEAQLASEKSSQAIEETQSQQQQPPTSDILSSSPGPMKNLPNSGLKRPRLDPIEATPLKRLKRTPANLEVRRTSRPPGSSGTYAADVESETTRTSRVSLPSGSRKGSVIGANAPAPGRARGSRKTSRKGSKSDLYSERFNE